jgi:hypothetical protein
MEIDPLDSVESDDDAAASRAHSRLNSRVAITVALLATFMGVCKVKDDNIVQGMQQAQADKIDHWDFYQARNIRQDVAQSTIATLTAQRRAAAPADRAAIDSSIARFQALANDEATKKDSLRSQATEDQKTYDSLNFRDDQFDLSDTLIALAISLLALTSLTKKEWLFWIAMVPTLLGAFMGLAGLAGWNIHPDSITRLLS